ncbi:MAG: hypothetical protein ACYTBZ_17105 [Planctomycetota bacterium]|jgi:hypothetical protein
MATHKHTWQIVAIVAAMLASARAQAGVMLTPVDVSRLYAYVDSTQSNGVSGWQTHEWNVLTDPLSNPSALAEYDPIGPPTDGWTLDGVSSFAIARSEMADAGGWTTPDDSDSFELFVNDQATGDPGGAPVGWGYSVAYLLVTYDTAPTDSSSVGDPVNIVLDLCLSGTLYAGGVYDDYFLDFGYALGTGLSDYDPVVVDPANNPNPGLSQFDFYQSWRSYGPSYEEPTHTDSLQFTCVIGDQVQVLIAVSSFSYSKWGYTWTDGTLGAIITASTPPPPPCATIEVHAAKHTVGSGSHPGSTKEPLVGIVVCAYDKSEGSCPRDIDICGGISHQHYQCIVDNCTPVACATTDSDGVALLDLPAGDYIIISADATKTVLPDPLGVSASDLVCGEVKKKHLQQIERANGSKKPGKTTRLTGSELLIIEPEYILWDDTQQLYPFIFETVGEWGVTTSVAPPEGFMADNESLSAFVDNEIESVQFTITEVGSDLVPTETTFEISHKGKKKKIKSKVGILLTPDYAGSRGFDVAKLRAKGLIKDKKRGR